MKLTPVEWLQIQIKNCPTAENLINNIDGFLMEAKSMEKDKALSQYDVSRRSEQVNCIHDTSRLRIIGSNLTCLDCKTTWRQLT